MNSSLFFAAQPSGRNSRPMQQPPIQQPPIQQPPIQQPPIQQPLMQQPPMQQPPSTTGTRPTTSRRLGQEPVTVCLVCRKTKFADPEAAHFCTGCGLPTCLRCGARQKDAAGGVQANQWLCKNCRVHQLKMYRSNAGNANGALSPPLQHDYSAGGFYRDDAGRTIRPESPSLLVSPAVEQAAGLYNGEMYGEEPMEAAVRGAPTLPDHLHYLGMVSSRENLADDSDHSTATNASSTYRLAEMGASPGRSPGRPRTAAGAGGDNYGRPLDWRVSAQRPRPRDDSIEDSLSDLSETMQARDAYPPMDGALLHQRHRPAADEAFRSISPGFFHERPLPPLCDDNGDDEQFAPPLPLPPELHGAYSDADLDDWLEPEPRVYRSALNVPAMAAQDYTGDYTGQYTDDYPGDYPGDYPSDYPDDYRYLEERRQLPLRTAPHHRSVPNIGTETLFDADMVASYQPYLAGHHHPTVVDPLDDWHGRRLPAMAIGDGSQHRHRSQHLSRYYARSTSRPDRATRDSTRSSAHSSSGSGAAGTRTGRDRHRPINGAARRLPRSASAGPASGHPNVRWYRSVDGSKWIGEMVLNKGAAVGQGSAGHAEAKQVLGLKVTGGRKVQSSATGGQMRRGAFITKVKPGSLAASVGHLHAGDEVLLWNGIPLRDKTFNEVFDIISASRHDRTVELVVERPAAQGPSPMTGSTWRMTAAGISTSGADADSADSSSGARRNLPRVPATVQRSSRDRVMRELAERSEMIRQQLVLSDGEQPARSLVPYEATAGARAVPRSLQPSGAGHAADRLAAQNAFRRRQVGGISDATDSTTQSAPEYRQWPIQDQQLAAGAVSIGGDLGVQPAPIAESSAVDAAGQPLFNDNRGDGGERRRLQDESAAAGRETLESAKAGGGQPALSGGSKKKGVTINDDGPASSSVAAATNRAQQDDMQRRKSLGRFGALVGLKNKEEETGKKKKGFARSVEVGVGAGPTRLGSDPLMNGPVSSTFQMECFLDPNVNRDNEIDRARQLESTEATGLKTSDDAGVDDRAGAGPDDTKKQGFIEELGPGQVVGRQVLGSASVGEIQLSLADKKGRLEVEVIRARGLQAKSDARSLPAMYVKVYLKEGNKVCEKQRTAGFVRNTLDPVWQQQLFFFESYVNRSLQVFIYGDYSRMDKKSFLGVAQVMFSRLRLQNIVIGWYKLFPQNSLEGITAPPPTTSAGANATDATTKKNKKGSKT